MTLFKIFLLAVTLSGCAHTYSNGNSHDIPDFESLVGSGALETSSTTTETVQDKAWITVNNDEIIPDKGSCESLILNSKDELLVKIALCGNKQEYIMCAGNASECIIVFETEKSGSSLSLINDSDSDETRFLVEFRSNKIIYRIQAETCLIGYPHGCIIDGFDWRDQYTYTYIYK